MSKKGAKQKEMEHRKADIVGLMPKKLYDALHNYGYYMLVPSDAFPFKMRAIHKLGFEIILEADTESELLIEAGKALNIFNKSQDDELTH